MKTDMALESLLQRGRTRLFNEIVDEVQKNIDALSELPKTNNDIVYKTLKDNKFDKNIVEVVKAHTGISIRKFEIVISGSPNAMASLDFVRKSWKNINNGVETIGSIMEKVNGVYNDRSAILYESDLKDSAPLIFNLYVHTAFWNIRKSDNSLLFTAEETAAIILHEIGHFDHFIRAFGRVYHRTLDSSDIINYVKSDPDKEVILNLISKMKSNKNLKRNWKKIIDNLETYFKNEVDTSSPEHMEAINSLCLVAQVSYSTLDVDDISVMGMWSFQSPYITPGGKLTTEVSEVDAERSADEFSARNGAYSYLVSSIDKLYAAGDRKSYDYLRQYLWVAPAIILSFYMRSMSIFNFNLEMKMFGYDSLLRRLELVSETAKHAFSDPNISESLKDELRQQIKESDKIIAEYKSSKSHQIRSTLFKWITNGGKLAGVLTAPFTNRNTTNYHTLQDSTRSLTRNPLHYLANK